MLDAKKTKQPQIETACRFAHVSGSTLKVRATHAGLRAFIVDPSILTICTAKIVIFQNYKIVK